jgi:hypothetical protein
MKKLLFYLSLILIVAFLFTSCSSTIMKRHYRNGYYVEHKKHKVSPDLLAKNKTVELTQQAFTKIKEEMALVNISAENALFQPELISKKNTETSDNNPIVKHAKNTETIAKNNKSDEVTMKKEFKRNNLRGTANSVKNPDAELVGAALSLMWILILIILAAYIIGLLAIADAASSGWIHILGVIVIVLLILWLLRLI